MVVAAKSIRWHCQYYFLFEANEAIIWGLWKKAYSIGCLDTNNGEPIRVLTASVLLLLRPNITRNTTIWYLYLLVGPLCDLCQNQTQLLYVCFLPCYYRV